MNQLIILLNKLQDVCNTVGYGKIEINWPQIIVVGAQSAGKSSVLESLVGKDFLPRGPNMVTRRPLILQLVHNEYNEPQTGALEWAHFGHRHDVYTDFEAVKKEVQEETNRIIGSSNTISPEPIKLTVYSPSVITLTLVDLPGLVQISAEGQPADIGKSIKELVKRYINNPNAIILAITPANTDLTTSHALKIAKESDPEGIRTLAVLTKLDAVDEGHREEITKVLKGMVSKIKLGIVGVINRSQKDINDKKNIELKRQEEKDYIEKTYPSIANEHGTGFLGARLNQLLSQHILKCIPEIRQTINDRVAQNKTIMEACALPADHNDKAALMQQAIREFAKDIKSTIKNGHSPAQHTKELVGGARIYKLFFATYPFHMDKVAVPYLNSMDIRNVIKNAMGYKTHQFTPQKAFEDIAQRYIEEIRQPSLELAESVRKELDVIIGESLGKMKPMVTMNYPNLVRKILDETSWFIQTRLEETKIVIHQHVNCELKFINTNHLDYDNYYTEATGNNSRDANLPENRDIFVEANDNLSDTVLEIEEPVSVWNKGAQGKKAPPDERTSKKNKPRNAINDQSTSNGSIEMAQFQGNLSNDTIDNHPLAQSPVAKQSTSYGRLEKPVVRESKSTQASREHDIHQIENALKAYTRIVRKTALDMVPKKIVAHLLKEAEGSLEPHLQVRINSTNVDDLMKEAPEILEKRRNAENILQACKAAESVLNDIKVTCSSGAMA